jgi:hypothetical protein
VGVMPVGRHLGGRHSDLSCVHPGSFVALGGDDRGTLIEILPRGLAHLPGPTESRMVAASFDGWRSFARGSGKVGNDLSTNR